MRWILALSLLSGGLIAGCTSSDYDARQEGVQMSAAGDSMDEKYAQTDPVCGVRVNPHTGVTEDWDGRTWYFDTDECRKKFHDDPTAYVGPRIDPVCGMKVESAPAAFREEFDGKTYFFDSMDCWQKFHNNPTAYVHGQKTPTEVR